VLVETAMSGIFPAATAALRASSQAWGSAVGSGAAVGYGADHSMQGEFVRIKWKDKSRDIDTWRTYGRISGAVSCVAPK
jgi:hypothetical protein